MKHYFVQHGKATAKELDSSRPLSPEGTSETRSVAKNLKKNHIQITQVFHSGKTRAEQTAEIFAKELSIPDTHKISGLSPNDDVKDFYHSQLLTMPNGALYVGHLPHLNKLISYLLTRKETSNLVAFQNSAVICIETVDNQSTLLWFITPTTI